MEATCPKCHKKTSIDALHLALSSSVVCASCGALFAVGQPEALLGSLMPQDSAMAHAPETAARTQVNARTEVPAQAEVAARAVAPETQARATAPASDLFEDILLIPQDAHAGRAAEPQAELLGDVFGETQPVAGFMADAPHTVADEPVATAEESVVASVEPAAVDEPVAVAAETLAAMGESESAADEPVVEASEFESAPDECVVASHEVLAASEETVVAGVGTCEAAEPRTNESDELHVSEAPCEQATPEEPRAMAAAAGQAAQSADGYAVGMRVLRIAPAWLLLCGVGFLSIILFLGWMARPVGEVKAADTASGEVAALKNEATNQQVEPAAEAQTNAPEAPAPAAEVAKVEAKPQQEAATPAAPQVAAPQVEAPGVEAGASEGKFAAQVGSYPNDSQANERVSQLRAAGFEARAVPAELPGRGVWYRVYSGRFKTRAEAADYGARLRAKGAAAQVIVAEVQQ